MANQAGHIGQTSNSTQQPFPNEYEYVYNVGLLDDLHNYFPALLYNQGQFQSVPSVLHYVRNQMNSRFNLYSYGAGLAQQRMPQQRMPPRAQARTQVQSQRQEVQIDSTELMSSILLGLLGTTSGDMEYIDIPRVYARNIPLGESRAPRGTRAVPQDYFDPVIVRPTNEVIERNTQILNGADIPAGTICVICQDTIRSTELCRKIITCSHTFHKSCIDEWFNTNVHCPSCRHDIRDSVLAPPNYTINQASVNPSPPSSSSPSSPRGPIL
jgi:hypothetical protein